MAEAKIFERKEFISSRQRGTNKSNNLSNYFTYDELFSITSIFYIEIESLISRFLWAHREEEHMIGIASHAFISKKRGRFRFL